MSKRPSTTARTTRRARERASRRAETAVPPLGSAAPEPRRRSLRPWFIAVAAVAVIAAVAAGCTLATSAGSPATSPSSAPSAASGAATAAATTAGSGSASVPSGSGAAASSAAGSSAAALPGLTTAMRPWPAETANLGARLQAIGLPVLAAEGTVLHIHQHIDIYVDGQPVTVPADIGINVEQQYLSPIHTHDATGIIHVESPTQRDFTLGEFFDVWGVRFDADCIGGACDGSGRTLSVYVNGQLVTGDPRAVVLQAHQEIVVALGTPSQLPSPIPSSYPFPAGY